MILLLSVSNDGNGGGDVLILLLYIEIYELWQDKDIWHDKYDVVFNHVGVLVYW